MTVRDVLGSVGRRWYVLMVVLVCVAALGISFARAGGTYTTTTIVTFTLPNKSTLQTNNGSDDQSVIAFASVVAAAVNAGKPVVVYSSSDAPYYGAGIRQGYAVSLRNDGSQWVASYPSATLELQIVGRSYAWVAATQKRVLKQIAESSKQEQTDSLTAQSQRISETVEPLTMQISRIAATRTSEIGAWVALGCVGVLVGAWGSVVLDRVLSGRRFARGFSSRRGRPLQEATS